MYLSPKAGQYENGDCYWERVEMLDSLQSLPTRMLADELVRRAVLAETAGSDE